MPASRTSALTPIVTGLMSNAPCGKSRNRVTRSGGGTVTAPLFSAVTTDICSPEPSWRVDAKRAMVALFSLVQLSVEPVGPW